MIPSDFDADFSDDLLYVVDTFRVESRALPPDGGHESRSWSRLIDLEESVEAQLGDLINTFFAAIEPGTVPSDPHLDGRVILDPKRSLHHRTVRRANGLYLIRPDGYVGYRSEPATASTLDDHLGRAGSL